MEEKKLEETMSNLDVPQVDVSEHQKEFRIRILNTKRSAGIGILLLVLPFLFLFGVVFKHYLQLDLGILTAVYEWIGEVDQKYGDSSILNWAIRLLLTVGPLVAILINLMAITHVRYEKKLNELIFSFKLKALNLVIILACGAIFSVFFLYLIVENV